MKIYIYRFLGLLILPMSLCSMDFSNYLNSIPYATKQVRLKKGETSFKFDLNTENKYTTLISAVGARPSLQYLFIAFSTRKDATIDPHLPRELQNELSRKLPRQDVNTVVKIYRTMFDNPSLYEEVASIETEKKLDSSIIHYVHINTMYLDNKGNLIVEYQNIRSPEGRNIKKMRVTYTRK